MLLLVAQNLKEFLDKIFLHFLEQEMSKHDFVLCASSGPVGPQLVIQKNAPKFAIS